MADDIRKTKGRLYEQLFLKDKHGCRVFFADLAVYTKNRAFRLYACSKYGKGRALDLADINQCKCDATSDEGELAIFKQSLIV